jgi:hypothetical protein
MLDVPLRCIPSTRTAILAERVPQSWRRTRPNNDLLPWVCYVRDSTPASIANNRLQQSYLGISQLSYSGRRIYDCDLPALGAYIAICKILNAQFHLPHVSKFEPALRQK